MKHFRLRNWLSLKRGFGGCGHGLDGLGVLSGFDEFSGFGGFYGLGGFGGFDRFSGFSRFSGFGGFQRIFKSFLSFIYSSTKGFMSSSKLSFELYLAEG